MLKKICLIGKLILSAKQKERNNMDFIDKPYESSAYYNLLVKTPNGSVTLIRCVVQGENLIKWNEDFNENDLVQQDSETIVKIYGILKNEMRSRQIMVKINRWEKIEKSFEELEEEKSNFVKLAGEVTEIRYSNDENRSSDIVSIKILSSSSFYRGIDNKSNIFFCRINNDDHSLSSLNLKKGDVVLIEGFLQTKKVSSPDQEKIEDRISAVICQRIIILDSGGNLFENCLSDIKVYSVHINKIDFSKPKLNEYRQ